MRHIAKYIFAMLPVLAMSSCEKSVYYPAFNESNAVVTATISSLTKVSYSESAGNLKQSWSVGDNIVGFTEEGDKIELNIPDSNHIKGEVATFEVVQGSIPQTDGKKVYLIYAPGKHYGDVGLNKTLSVDISSQGSTSVPALMMATGIVTGGKVSLQFSNEMSILCMKNPTIAASKGTAITKMSLNAANIYTKAEFSVDGSGNLIMTPTTIGTITKDCNFTPGSEDGTTTDTEIYFAVFPNSLSADLTISTESGNSVTVPSKSLSTGKYYYFGATFPETSKSIVLQGDDLNFSIASGKSYTVGGVTISAEKNCTYSSGNFTGQGGNKCFTFSLTDNTLKISKIEIFCSSIANTSKNFGWTDDTSSVVIEEGVQLLKWPADSTTQPASSVAYARSITGVTKIVVSYK